MKLIYIEWIDSAGVDGWVDIDSVKNEVIPIKSIGWLAAVDSKTVTIMPHVSTHEPNPQCSGAMSIPRVAIVKMLTVQLGSDVQNIDGYNQ